MKKIFVNILAGLLVLAGIAAFSACDRGEPNTSSAPTEVSFVDFETWAPDFQLCRISSTFGKVSMNTDEQFVSCGKRSARIDPVGSGWMYLPTYSDLFDYDYTDFTYVDSVRFDMYNPQDEEKTVNVGLVASTNGIDSFERAGEVSFKLQPGWNKLDFYVDPSVVCIIADLSAIQGVYFTFEVLNLGSITETTPRYYLDNIRLHYSATPNEAETELEFGENEIIDFERFYHSNFYINEHGVEMGIVNAAAYGINATSGSKVLRMVIPGTATGAWKYYFQLMGPFMQTGPLGKLSDSQFENGYFCWDVYNASEAEYNIVALFENASGREDYRIGTIPKKGQWTTFRVKLTDIEQKIPGWREDMGTFVFSILDAYNIEREVFFDNFRVEFEESN